jgi:hypothetical protein
MSDEQNDDERERQLAEDNAEFGLENAVGTGDATLEVTTTNSNKLVLIGLIAGTISLLLVSCLTVGFIGYAMTNRKSEANAADQVKKEQFDPAEEAKAKIKQIDREARVIRFLMSNNTRKTYQVTDQTEFLDRDGNAMPKGIQDALLREDEYCIILPTDDQTELRWLKLTAPPK